MSRCVAPRCRKPTHEPPICARSVPKAALARPLPTRQTRKKGRLNFLYPILLIGIAVKNSILLVDYAVMAEEKGMTRHEALMDACHKRARPVIMTTLAMGAGMMPIALGLTADSSFRMPMAVAVIGGLITSTVLSLVVVPAAYTLVDDLEERVLGKLRRKAADASEVAAPP
ncbi:hypothetical protein CO641_09015 [Lysobacteraceae bacterium NML91-0213]|nr:hypothetical protein CO641_09015 [Xanthomonadaceae bacterium NML91-0213]